MHVSAVDPKHLQESDDEIDRLEQDVARLIEMLKGSPEAVHEMWPELERAFQAYQAALLQRISISVA